MTECNTQLSFEGITPLPVTVDFAGGNLTTDSGLLLVRQLEDRMGLIRDLAACLPDRRDPAKVRHSMFELLLQRVLQIVGGYEDANDAETLRFDPALKAAVGRAPESGADLASQPTLSRLENAVTPAVMRRMSRVLLTHYLRHRPHPGRAIILDLDATDDPTHGQQEFSFFHGFYDQHMYHPLLCYDGASGDLISVMLRPGKAHAAAGVRRMLRPIVRQIRACWPEVEIIVRADAGFCVPRLYRFCERHNLGYVIGLIGNQTLKALHAPLLRQAEELFAQDQHKVRLMGEVGYRAQSWEGFRRVVMKAEVMPEGTNRRFVVTNLLAEPKELYDFYVRRGEVENRIKDLKLGLAVDRLSCHRFLANQMRLLLHAAAYVLMHTIRQLLGGTELAGAQFDTIRLRLLKIGARVRQTARRIWVHLASSYPGRELWEHLHAQLLLLTPAPS